MRGKSGESAIGDRCLAVAGLKRRQCLRAWRAARNAFTPGGRTCPIGTDLFSSFVDASVARAFIFLMAADVGAVRLAEAAFAGRLEFCPSGWLMASPPTRSDSAYISTVPADAGGSAL